MQRREVNLAFASYVERLRPVPDDVAVAQVHEVNAHDSESRVRPAESAFLEKQIDRVAPMRVQGQEISTCNLVGAHWKSPLQLFTDPVETYHEIELLTQSVQQTIVAGTSRAANVKPVAVHENVRPVSAYLHLKHVWHVVAEPRVGVLFSLAVEKRACR